MRLEITEEAQRDLRAIHRHIAKDNRGRADSFVLELVDRCETLVESGHRYPFLRGRERAEIRRCLHKPYLIVYRMSAELVEVLHIIHSARDYERILFPDED